MIALLHRPGLARNARDALLSRTGGAAVSLNISSPFAAWGDADHCAIRRATTGTNYICRISDRSIANAARVASAPDSK